MVNIGTLRFAIEHAEYAGGTTSPDGDSVQYKTENGEVITVYLCATFGDTAPSDKDVLRTASRAGIAAHVLPYEECEEITPDEWTGYKPVRATGKSLTIAITEGCRILGVDVGDYVEVTIRKA